MSVPIAIDSDVEYPDGIGYDDSYPGAVGPVEDSETAPEPFIGFPSLGEMSSGDTIDDSMESDPIPPATTEIAKPKTRGSRSRSATTKTTTQDETPPRDAKSGPPTLDEWQGFLSRVVLRCATDWYLNFAFRGIDEDALSEREIERLAMTDDERKLISVPFAELANKSKFMRKHGRTIVASGDAFNAMVVIGAWMSRVNRIAAKHRPQKPVQGRVVHNGSSGQGTPQASPDEFHFGSTGGRFPPGFNGGIIPGSG